MRPGVSGVRLGAALIAIAVAATGCGTDGSLGDMQLRVLSGQVHVIRGGEPARVEGTFDLEVGDVIVTQKGGRAEFALEGGDTQRKVTLAPDSAAEVSSGTSVEAREGQVLVQADVPTEATFDDVRARTDKGAFRIDRGVGGVRVGAYGGGVVMDAPGEGRLRLDAYYEANVVVGDLPDQVDPYSIDLDDPWDQQLLDDVIDLESQLSSLARGFSNQLGGARPTVTYFSSVAGADAGYVTPYLTRKPGDVLVAFLIALNADDSPADSMRRAFALYEDGAAWGIVAKILGAPPKTVLPQLRKLILGTGVVKKNGRGQNPNFAGGADPGPGASGPGDGGNSVVAAPPPTQEDPSEDPPQEDPGDDDKKKPDSCGNNSTECTLEELEDQLGGGEEEEPEPSPSPTEEKEKSGGGILDSELNA